MSLQTCHQLVIAVSMRMTDGEEALRIHQEDIVRNGAVQTQSATLQTVSKARRGRQPEATLSDMSITTGLAVLP